MITANDVVRERRDVHGNGRIIDISHKYVKDMPAWESKEGMGQFLRLLLSTKNGSFLNWSEFMLSVHSGTHVGAPGHVYDDYFGAGLDMDSLDSEVLNGLDYPSVAAYVDAVPTHLVFLKSREIILVEGLKLDNVNRGLYNVHCLPLRLPGAEGAQARCILIG